VASLQPITMSRRKTNLNLKHQVDKYRLCLCIDYTFVYICMCVCVVISIWYSKTVRLCDLTHICQAHTSTGRQE